MRIMAIDPGEKNIGIAVSDSTGMIANPVAIIQHQSRMEDAKQLLLYATELGAELIVVGVALDQEGGVSFTGRKSIRLIEMMRTMTTLPIEITDEYGSTNEAQQAVTAMGIRKKYRPGHHDDLAAVIILQKYLDLRSQTL